MKFLLKLPLLSLGLLLFPLAAVATLQPFVTTKAAVAKKTTALLKIPRGGANGLLDPDLAAKIYFGSYGLNALQGVLTPATHLKCYGMKPDARSPFIAQAVTATGLGTIVLLYLQKFRDMAFEEALSWSLVPYAYQTVVKHLTNRHKDMGMTDTQSLWPLAFNAALFIALHSGAGFTSTLTKCLGVYILFNAAQFGLSPEKAGKAAGMESKSPQNKMLLSLWGCYLTCAGMAVASQAFGASLDQAIAYSALGIAIPLVLLGLDGAMARAGVPSNIPAYAWSGGLVWCAVSILKKAAEVVTE